MGLIHKPQYGRLSLLLGSTMLLAPGMALAQSSSETTLESVVVTAQTRE
jgi:hypothetical protein